MGKKHLALFMFLFLIAGTMAEAQQPVKVYKIGLLLGFGGLFPSSIEAFRQGLRGLREFGYLEGQNIAVEHRVVEYHVGAHNRLAELAAEVVQTKVDVIVANTTMAALAAKKATKTIPIVFASVSDPVGAGLVTSLARPGENVTGLTQLAPEVGGKRLELLKDSPAWPSSGTQTVQQDKSRKCSGSNGRPMPYALNFSPWTRGSPATSKRYFMPPTEVARKPLLHWPLRGSPAIKPK
jgi:ABC transporter substrate binding protein